MSAGVIICPVRSCGGKTKQLYKGDKKCLEVFKNKPQINGKVFSYRDKATPPKKNKKQLTNATLLHAGRETNHTSHLASENLREKRRSAHHIITTSELVLNTPVTKHLHTRHNGTKTRPEIVSAQSKQKHLSEEAPPQPPADFRHQTRVNERLLIKPM